jgi:cytoskeleton protein RodZ
LPPVAPTTSSQAPVPAPAPVVVAPVAPEPVKSVADNKTVSASAQPNTSAQLQLAPVIAPSQPPEALPKKGMANLEFSANQETWVNVVDANGREVYSKTIFAGSRETVDVKPPVNVTVGNAGATTLTMNGKMVDLAPHSRNNVAHIKLENSKLEN